LKLLLIACIPAYVIDIVCLGLG